MRPGSKLAGSPPATAANRQSWVLAAAAVTTLALALRLSSEGWRFPVLLLIGVALGITLQHAAFGFTTAWRRLLVRGDVHGVRAQLLMLAVATGLFAPVLAAGGAFGQEVVGAAAPLGVQVFAGAFAFGIGMQLASGCGSGALYTAGGGNPRMALVLAAFCAGSFWASLHMGWWQALPQLDAVVLGEAFGWLPAAAAQIGFLLLLFLLLRRFDRTAEEGGPASGPVRFLRGPWPLMWGGLVLAGLNFATLLVAGHPWTITWAFTLWGAKAATALGWDPVGSGFWDAPFQKEALAASVLDDVTSVMDIGILLGAAVAATLGGRFRPGWRIPARSLAAALIGGVLMGYGARIAFGCNVGAFFSGVASTSLHGWLWIAAALAGSWIGVKLRPRFGLAIETRA